MKRLFSIIVYCLVTILPLFAKGNYRHFTVADGLLNNQVRQLVELPNGQILVVTEGMFSLYNGQRFIPQACHLDSIYTLPTFGGHSFYWQGDSLLWLKDFYSLYLYDARTRHFRYDYESRIHEKEVYRFTHENGDSVTKSHVEALHLHRKTLEGIIRETPLEEEWLQTYLCDRQGGQWFGLQNAGIVYVPPSHDSIECLSPVPHDDIYRMEELEDNRAILAGAKGIYLYNWETQQIERTIDSGNINSFNIRKDARRRIWISTMQALYCYDKGNVSTYSSGNVEGFPHWYIRFAYPMADGRVLVCVVTHTIGYLYPEEKRFEVLNDKLTDLNGYRTMVMACATDHPDTLMVGTQNGVFLLNTKTNEMTVSPTIQSMEQYSRKYNCLHRDRLGRTWLGTQNGLLVMKDSHIKRISMDEGLSNNCIQSITEDHNGNLWVGTTYGINRISYSEDSFSIYPLPVHETMQRETIERGACTMKDGRVYFVTRGGIIRFHPKDFHFGNEIHVVIPIEIKVGGKSIGTRDTITHLQYRDNYIEIKFSALNYANPDHIRYRYRLTGLENGWNYAKDGDGLVLARYNALPAGEYTFEVQATEGDTTWGPTYRKTFIINPPWWRTWWAKSIYILLATASFTAAVSLYLQKRKKKIERDNDARVNRLFELREEARHHFVHSVNIEPGKISINKNEEDLIEKIMDAIHKNMDNTDYTIDILARDIGLSRAAIYKKMQQMLGITPNEFLRNVRLKHAASLLVTTELPITQISLMVGFLTTRYFSQCFKKTFGVLPSEYRGAGQVSLDEKELL